MTSYTLDTTEARKADQRGGVITETGKYIGKITRAEDITAATGTKGIDFSFVSRDGMRGRFSLYTIKADGARIGIGHGYLMALMTCLRVREIKQAQTRVKKWDFDAGAELDVTVPCYPELMNKDIGVLLEAEEYTKKDSSIGKRMVLAGVFQAESELTASEILDKKVQGDQLGKIVATLRDRPLRASRSAAPAASGGAAGLIAADDDIPFIVNLLETEVAQPKARRLRRAEF